MTHDPTPQPGLADDDIERIAVRVGEILRPILNEIHQLSGITGSLAEATWKADAQTAGPQPEHPDINTPRPIAIDRACAAATNQGTKKRVHLIEYDWTGYVKPGSNPQQVWMGIVETLTGGTDGEVRHRRRASGS